jgi:hypothetical protein
LRNEDSVANGRDNRQGVEELPTFPI